MSFRKFYAALAVIVAGTLQLHAQKAPSDPTTYKLLKDLPYYAVSTPGMTPYQQERCRLDLYYPENKKGYPTVVWFHGGGLTNGSKWVPSELKNRGIAVAAVNYRLSPKAKCADSIADAAAAVAWVINHIAEYGGNPGLVFVSGHSAGGYLTMMVGLDPRWLAPFKIGIDRLAGLIPLSGHTITHMTVRKERGISSKQPIVDDFAPLYHVGVKNPPPLLLITGDREKEMLGRYEENAYMMRMMKVNGHKAVTLYEIQGYGHGMATPAFPLELEFIRKIVAEKNKK